MHAVGLELVAQDSRAECRKICRPGVVFPHRTPPSSRRSRCDRRRKRLLSEAGRSSTGNSVMAASLPKGSMVVHEPRSLHSFFLRKTCRPGRSRSAQSLAESKSTLPWSNRCDRLELRLSPKWLFRRTFPVSATSASSGFHLSLPIVVKASGVFPRRLLSDLFESDFCSPDKSKAVFLRIAAAAGAPSTGAADAGAAEVGSSAWGSTGLLDDAQPIPPSAGARPPASAEVPPGGGGFPPPPLVPKESCKLSSAQNPHLPNLDKIRNLSFRIPRVSSSLQYRRYPLLYLRWTQASYLKTSPPILLEVHAHLK